jgi:hypothetical protein
MGYYRNPSGFISLLDKVKLYIAPARDYVTNDPERFVMAIVLMVSACHSRHSGGQFQRAADNNLSTEDTPWELDERYFIAIMQKRPF